MAGFMVIWILTVAGYSSSGWIIRTWQTDDGLPNNVVTGLSQAKDGYLWVATHNGLARFDGFRFEDFPLTNFAGIPSKEIATLLSVKTGGLWLAFDLGPLAYLHFGNAETITNPFPSHPTVTAMTEDDDGGLFVAFGLKVVRIKNGQVKEFTAPDGLPDGICSSLIRDTDGRVWLAKGAEVGVLKGDHFEKLLAFNTGRAVRLAAAKSGGIWVCVNDQLFTCNDKGVLGKISEFGVKNSLPRPTVLLEDQCGCVWIGTRRNGLFRFDGSNFQSIPTSHNWILCLAEDREGNIWAGTSGGGLDEVRPELIQLEGAGTGFASQTIQSICEDSQGRLWGLSQSGLLMLRVHDEWSLVSSNTDWPNIAANDLVADREGSLWMETTGHKLARWQNGVFKFWGPENGIRGPIRKILASSTGDIWIGEGQPEILQFFHADTLKTLSLPSNFHHILAMAEVNKTDIYVAGEHGELMRVWPDHGQYKTERVSRLPRQTIRCLSTTSDGSLWIGYDGAGVGRLDKNGQFTLIGRDQGLYDDNISQIIDDERGSLWFGSDHGIFRVQKNMLDAVAEGRLASVYSTFYGANEGLPDLRADLANAGGALRSRDGRLWMPMGASLAIINPEKLREDLIPPTVLLTHIEVDEHTVASYGGEIMPVQNAIALEKTGASLNLQPTHHRLDFNFTVLDFAAPDNVSFRYKLEGLDVGWSKASPQRNATYSRLSPGGYRFQVMACNSSGIWNETGASFGFTVMPFIWQTWWFRLVAVVLFTAAVLSVGRYFSHRKLQRRLLKFEQQAALDKERARIARDLHDDLGSCLTKIVMVSGLSRRGRIPTEKADNEVQTAARYAIKALDQTVWAVNPQNDTVPAFVNYTSQFVVDFLRTAGIKCDTDIAEQLPERAVPAEARHNLFLVIKETVNNIVRHANATDVKFQVAISDTSLRFTIQDNGSGFAHASTAPNADGLRNMRQRMDELGGEFQIESTSGTGTRIVIVFRLSS
jgi:signal transduction histidine kinase/ligand-binding sensor domain-containing protein